jgi:hypothetical protein
MAEGPRAVCLSKPAPSTLQDGNIYMEKINAYVLMVVSLRTSRLRAGLGDDPGRVKPGFYT